MKNIFAITLCTLAFSTTQICSATELDTTILTNSNSATSQNLLPDAEVVSYGLIPNPFKIISKTATAPIRAAKSKIKAAKKAAKLAKKGVDTVKDIDGDAKGKGPTVDYEKTPYTKDKYYSINKNKKSVKKSSKDKFEDYKFDTNTINTNERPYVNQRNQRVTIVEDKVDRTDKTVVNSETYEKTTPKK